MTNIKWDTTFYDTKHAFVSSFGEDLIELLQPLKDEKILDLGCGTGHLTSKIAESGAMVTGIDSSPDMISSAKILYPNVNFEVKDATDFSFDELFDAIFSNAVLHWVEEKEKAIICMYRNLKAGGRVVVEFGGKGNVELLINALKDSLDHLLLKDKNEFKVHWYFPSIGEYCTLLENHGFQVKYAVHFDRLTELNTKDGIKDWFRMFGEKFLENFSEKDVGVVLQKTQNALKNSLHKEGKWYADYKRIRIVAVKE